MTTNGTVRRVIYMPYTGALYVRNAIWFRVDTHKCNRKKSTEYHVPTFTKLNNAQQHYARICYIEFRTK